jgi:hypothetical protein
LNSKIRVERVFESIQRKYSFFCQKNLKNKNNAPYRIQKVISLFLRMKYEIKNHTNRVTKAMSSMILLSDIIVFLKFFLKYRNEKRPMRKIFKKNQYEKQI